MSVVSVERKSPRVGQHEHTVDLPTPIQEKLRAVVRQDRRAELVHRVSVVAAAGLLIILGLVVVDVLFGLRSAAIRWVIWGAGLGIAGGAIRYCLVKPPRCNQQLLDAAWKIESSHPAMEERLASTVQFLNEDSRRNTSPQLIDALVIETADGVGCIDAESIPTRSSGIPAMVAAVLATALVFSVTIWPQAVLTSLDNLATPWSPYAVPALAVYISPGDVTIVEGESIHIEVVADDDLDHPTLEIIRGDDVESHAMVATSPEVSMFTLTDLRQDAVYRIRSGGLYSVPHTITVYPQPQLKAISGQLSFPEYSDLGPLAIEQVIEPIEVPAGTKVTLSAMSDGIGVDGAIRWKSDAKEIVARKVSATGSPDSALFEWTFNVAPATNLVGMLEVRSEHGVGSVPYPIEIRAVDDLSPKIEITTPSLRQLTMRRDGALPIRYRVIDDFGVSQTELVVKFGEQEPVARSCAAPEKQAGKQMSWIGATSLELAEVPPGSDEISLWLKVADNRPDEFGGPQVIESEAIHITLDDRADSLGQQQILADRQLIEQSLDRAIEQMREAMKAAESLQHDPEVESDRLNSKAEQIDALRQQTSKAKQTLVQLTEKLDDESNLFRPKAAKVQQVADQEVSEALELANQIPLADDQPQQDKLAREAEQQLTSAVDQLEDLKSDVKQQAEQMNQAAQLDQLASMQERLARKAAEGDQKDAPDEQWRDRQQEVADGLQALVEEDPEARRQQLLQRADDAEQLAQQAQQLAEQQQQLEQAMHEAQEGELDQAVAKVQEQIAEQAEKIQQQAEQLAKQDNPEPVVQKQAKRAAEQLQQAQKNADQAKQSLCEKCNGGGQEQGAKPQNPNPAQQAAQPNEAGIQQQARQKDEDAEINRKQQDAARSLQEAAQSLNQVCKNCRECANGRKPGASGGSQGSNSKNSGLAKPGSTKPGSTKNGSPEKGSTRRSPTAAKQLANASDDADQATQSPTNNKATQNAESVAEQLNQLADEAAQESGYSLRQQKGSPQQQGSQQGTDNKPDNNARNGQSSADPKGVGKAAGDTHVDGQKLRSDASSNWTRSRRKLDGGVLDDREGNVPEQYRGVVKRYFEELSRQQSSRVE